MEKIRRRKKMITSLNKMLRERRLLSWSSTLSSSTISLTLSPSTSFSLASIFSSPSVTPTTTTTGVSTTTGGSGAAEGLSSLAGSGAGASFKTLGLVAHPPISLVLVSLAKRAFWKAKRERFL
jgi:hypothetical protein